MCLHSVIFLQLSGIIPKTNNFETQTKFGFGRLLITKYSSTINNISGNEQTVCVVSVPASLYIDLPCADHFTVEGGCVMAACNLFPLQLSPPQIQTFFPATPSLYTQYTHSDTHLLFGVALRPNYQLARRATNFQNWLARIEFGWPKQY